MQRTSSIRIAFCQIVDDFSGANVSSISNQTCTHYNNSEVNKSER